MIPNLATNTTAGLPTSRSLEHSEAHKAPCVVFISHLLLSNHLIEQNTCVSFTD